MRNYCYRWAVVLVAVLAMGPLLPAFAQDQIKELEADKLKAEQRLKDRVQESLQLIREIENQKKALMEAAELLRSHKALQKQHKELEDERKRLATELDAANTRISALEKDLESRREREKTLKAAHKELKASHRAVEGQLRDATAEGARLAKKLQRSEANVAQLNDTLATVKDSKKDLQSQLRSVEVDTKRIQGVREDQARQLNIVGHELELAQAQNARLTRELEATAAREDELLAENKSLRRQFSAAAIEVDERERQLEQLSSQNRELEQRAKQTSFTTRETVSERVLRAELNQQVMITEDLIAENQRVTTRQRELQAALDKLNRQLEFAQAASAGLQGRSTWSMQQNAVVHSTPRRTMVEREAPVTTFAAPEPAQQLSKPYATIRLRDWIRRQNPAYYSLQLITLPNEKFVNKFFEMYPLDYGERGFYVSDKGGKRVFNVIFGVFDSELAAQQGMQRLPEDIKKKHPVILEFASIQKLSR